MTATDWAMSFFRTMKGANHTVLAVLAYNGRPMTNRQLQLWTGYHADTVTRATHDLTQIGWVAAQTPTGPWFVAHGRRVPCLHTRPEIGVDTPASENPGTASEISGFPSSIGGLEEGNQKDQDLQPPDSKPGDPNFTEAVKALRAAGIHDPALSRLAHLPHITAEYVRAHVEKARLEGRGLGAAVFRMERHWRVASSATAGRESEESRRRRARENIRRFLEE